MKILIVDDESGFVEALQEMLRRGAHKIDVAYDGKKALDFIKSNKYDLVFLDHNMPELTGLELVKYMKTNKIQTKTVIITAYPGINSFFAETMGADEYLTKPVKMEEVEGIIAKYADKI